MHHSTLIVGNYKLRVLFSFNKGRPRVNDIIINGMKSIFPDDIVVSEENYIQVFHQT